MQTTNRSPRVGRKMVFLATALAMAAVLGGWALAAGITITTGNAETGAGAYHATNALTYFTESAVGLGSQPAGLTTLSAVVATPTVLAAAATTYAINAPTAGDVVHFWKFTEAAGAPASTELELEFTVSTGAGPTVTQTTVYVETQAASPGAAIVFTLNYDLGNAATASITLDSVLEVSQQCSAVGTCP
jgi:hypothetical protein